MSLQILCAVRHDGRSSGSDKTLAAVRCVGLATDGADLRLQLRADCMADCHNSAGGDGRLDSRVTVDTRWAARQYGHSGHTMGC